MSAAQTFEPAGWDWWMAAIADPSKIGTPELPIHEVDVMTGFYRTKPKDGSKPVAIWYDQDSGDLLCKIGDEVVSEDRARAQWTWFCRQPVSHEAYVAKTEHGEWPDEVIVEINGEKQSTAEKPKKAEEKAPAGVGLPGRGSKAKGQKAEKTQASEAAGKSSDDEPNPRATIGDNSAGADGIDTEIENFREELATWQRKLDAELKDGDPMTADHEKRVADIGDKMADIAKRMDNARDARVRPLNEQVKEINKVWKPPIGEAEDQKRRAKKACEPYRLKLDRERREKEQAEAERRQKEAEQNGDLAGAAAEPARPASRGRQQATGLVTRSYAVLDDPIAVARFLLECSEGGRQKPDADLMDLLTKKAGKMLMAGAPVPGARLEERKEAR
jgi:hypothetical protein